MDSLSALPWIGILVATVVAFLLGGAWFSQPLFGKQWMAAVGKTPEQMGKPGPAMALSFGMTLLTAIGIALIEQRLIASTGGSIRLGLTLGFLIYAPGLASDFAFTNSSRTLYLIQASYHALMLTLMSLILHLVWR